MLPLQGSLAEKGMHMLPIGGLIERGRSPIGIGSPFGYRSGPIVVYAGLAAIILLVAWPEEVLTNAAPIA